MLFPDTIAVLDLPQTGIYEMYPKGGVTVEAAPDDPATARRRWRWGGSASQPAAIALDDECSIRSSDSSC